jgi:hypothetical protein
MRGSVNRRPYVQKMPLKTIIPLRACNLLRTGLKNLYKYWLYKKENAVCRIIARNVLTYHPPFYIVGDVEGAGVSTKILEKSEKILRTTL